MERPNATPRGGRADPLALCCPDLVMRCRRAAATPASAARHLVEFFVLQFLFVRLWSVFLSRLLLVFLFRASSACRYGNCNRFSMDIRPTKRNLVIAANPFVCGSAPDSSIAA